MDEVYYRSNGNYDEIEEVDEFNDEGVLEVIEEGYEDDYNQQSNIEQSYPNQTTVPNIRSYESSYSQGSDNNINYETAGVNYENIQNYNNETANDINYSTEKIQPSNYSSIQSNNINETHSVGDLLDKPLGEGEHVPDALQEILESYRSNFENIINHNTNQPPYRTRLLSIVATYNYLIRCIYPNKINNQSSAAVDAFINSNQFQ